MGMLLSFVEVRVVGFKFAVLSFEWFVLLPAVRLPEGKRALTTGFQFSVLSFEWYDFPHCWW
jgi:hypothetical protein